MDNDMEKFIPYIGLTYKPSAREHDTVDCWGLIVTLYEDLYGVTLPKFNECSYAKNGMEGTASYISSTELYKKCLRLTENDTPQEGDLILLTNAGQPTHIGMVVDSEHMIHAFDKAGSVIESFRSNKWKSRVIGIYRHPHFLS